LYTWPQKVTALVDIQLLSSVPRLPPKSVSSGLKFHMRNVQHRPSFYFKLIIP
jgi:hypothetical protein